MNDRIKYKSSSLTAASSELTRLADVLEDVSRDLSRIDTSGKWWTKLNINTHAGRYDARGALRVMINDADKARDYAADITDGIRDAQRLFDEADRKVLAAAKAAATGKGNDYDKNDASGSSSSAWSTGKTVSKVAKFLVDFGQAALQVTSTAVRTYKNYKRIGPAMGVKIAQARWVRNAFDVPKGWKANGSNGIAKWMDSLTNPKSPFGIKAQFKSFIGDFTGKSGVGKAVASWAGLVLDGAINWFGNKQEQAESGGTMSEGRVVTETVVETALGTAATFLTTAALASIVGATAAAGTVLASPIVIAAGAAVIVSSVDNIVEKVTGKSATEHVTDFIVNTGESMMNAVGNAANKAKNAVGKWFNDISAAWAL